MILKGDKYIESPLERKFISLIQKIYVRRLHYNSLQKSVELKVTKMFDSNYLLYNELSLSKHWKSLSL